MQDSPQDSDKKQYFDIKGPSNPDPTSRPVINSDPIQADPMVSPTAGDATSVDSSAGDSIPVSSASTTSEPASNSVEVPDVPGGADPEAVVYKDPEPKTTEDAKVDVSESTSPAGDENKETVPVTSSVADGETDSDKPLTDSAEPDKEATSASENSSPSESDKPSAIDNPALPTDVLAGQPSTPQAVTPAVSAAAKPAKNDKMLKTIIGVLILILLVVTALIVYKFKIGK
jgi:hypothetical protein